MMQWSRPRRSREDPWRDGRQRRRARRPDHRRNGRHAGAGPTRRRGAQGVRDLVQRIPAKVAADGAYQNARKHSDKQNARIEHDKALERVMTAVLKDDTQLFKEFSDNEGFRRWLTDTVFDLTYGGSTPAGPG